jgi:hypothetical protein
MRVTTLLGDFLLATSLFCSASDQAITPPISSLVGPSGKSGFKSVPLLDQHALAHSLPPKVEVVRPDADVCYTMRTYIMVREDRDSDVTRRDGYVTCQPAWKFEVRTAVGTIEER